MLISLASTFYLSSIYALSFLVSLLYMVCGYVCSTSSSCVMSRTVTVSAISVFQFRISVTDSVRAASMSSSRFLSVMDSYHQFPDPS